MFRPKNGFEQLSDDDESSIVSLVPGPHIRTKKSFSGPAKILVSCSKKFKKLLRAAATGPAASVTGRKKPSEAIRKASRVHPFFSLFETKKRATARPEFSRYVEYVKEGGGAWDVRAKIPAVICDDQISFV